jgi:DNA-3-methyladenine glycosylase I
MSKANVRKQILEKNSAIFIKEKEKPLSSQGLFTKHLKRVYPIGLHRSSSSLSLSSVSLSLSQSSNDDSSLTDCSATPLEQKISLALRLISPSERREVPVARNFQTRQQRQQQQQKQDQGSNEGELKRCNWITKNSGIV